MTAQFCDSFEYKGEEFCLLGYTGGTLLDARDFGMSFQNASTADARGFRMVYGVDDDMLVVKHIMIVGSELEPILHKFKPTINKYPYGYADLNEVIPLTGFVLFSDYWTISSLYSSDQYRLFEIEVEKGKIIEIREIGEEIRNRLKGRDSLEVPLVWNGNTDDEWIASLKRAWDFTETVLPRKYDAVYMSVWYTNFKEAIAELRSKK